MLVMMLKMFHFQLFLHSQMMFYLQMLLLTSSGVTI
jgi:hypothetical protein